MKTKLLLLLYIPLSLFTQAQETEVNVTLNAGYANQVYYKLSTQTATSFNKNSWDIALLRTSSFNHGIRVNDGIGIEVYQVSNNPADWDDVDVNSQGSWTILYNSDTERANGAFMQGTATNGWGVYNSTTHHIVGEIIYVLKYPNGSYKKFFCQDYFGGYTFKYANWNGSAWDDDKNATVSNSTNTVNNYNYYSLQNDQQVVAEPASTDWDFVFTKYFTLLPQGSYYNVTGVLHADNVTVAEAEGNNTSSLTYSEDINTIGYDWKTFNGGGFSVDSNKKYYIKYENNTIYKLYFTQFGGSANGNITFMIEDVTSSLGIENIDDKISFGVYPNPVKADKKLNLIYNVNSLDNDNNTIEIYNLQGQKVYNTTLKNNVGFYNKEIYLDNLSSGIYLLKFISGKKQITKKIILGN